jgi:hypothetical protein
MGNSTDIHEYRAAADNLYSLEGFMLSEMGLMRAYDMDDLSDPALYRYHHS